MQVNGISLHVEDHGSGRPVLLLHGWPDSAYLCESTKNPEAAQKFLDYLKSEQALTVFKKYGFIIQE